MPCNTRGSLVTTLGALMVLLATSVAVADTVMFEGDAPVNGSCTADRVLEDGSTVPITFEPGDILVINEGDDILRGDNWDPIS